MEHSSLTFRWYFKHPEHARIHPLTQQTPRSRRHLSTSLEGLREAADVVLDGALVAEELNVGTVNTDAALLALGDVLLTTERGETPVLGDDDLLATGELVLRATESLDGNGAV